MDKNDSAAFYDRLREELLKSTTWPSDYLYKFIVPSDPEKINRIQAVFDNTGAVIESRQSRKGKYTSLSVTVNLRDPDAVISFYRRVGEIPGVISL
ncbi:DUF493 family protein [Robiginitalea sp. SC105]|uniref:DUF493 family protein n=1 Tax=Robiginitalea sp. SC105 TaxID=2762332 RepID=UPI001639CA93|nr:DUF493 family protein [Robiginitalea sp. SC105]MBC2840373.1 DUF493 domain-containing protein [Robiginitalea sp. SC105]